MLSLLNTHVHTNNSDNRRGQEETLGDYEYVFGFDGSNGFRDIYFTPKSSNCTWYICIASYLSIIPQ